MCKQIQKLFPALCIIFIYSCSTPRPITKVEAEAAIIEGMRTEREFRAAWVATVSNINWPSKPGLSTAEQKAKPLPYWIF